MHWKRILNKLGKNMLLKRYSIKSGVTTLLHYCFCLPEAEFLPISFAAGADVIQDHGLLPAGGHPQLGSGSQKKGGKWPQVTSLCSLARRFHCPYKVSTLSLFFPIWLPKYYMRFY